MCAELVPRANRFQSRLFGTLVGISTVGKFMCFSFSCFRPNFYIVQSLQSDGALLIISRQDMLVHHEGLIGTHPF